MAEFPKLSGKAVLAPMAGVTDVAFRALARKYGAALAYTEFVSSTAVSRDNEKTWRMLKADPIEKPSAVQVFGSSIDEIVDAAKKLSKFFDIIDINCGCPAVKVMKTGAGSELMRDARKIGEIVKQVSSAVKNPVTVKIRAGYREKRNGVEAARIAEKSGAKAVAVHARMFGEGYATKADWRIIADVKSAVSIPVIGNGDVKTPEDAKRMLDETKADYVMVGRAAIPNPFIFTQINEYLARGKFPAKDGISQFRDYLLFAENHKIGLEHLKRHATAFTRGVPGGAGMRDSIMRAKSADAVVSCLGRK